MFLDEIGSNTSLAPLYAWAPKGKRARCSTPRNRGKNTTLLACVSAEGMGTCLAVLGNTTRNVFESYAGQVPSPTLRPGHVVVLDNLGAHIGERVRELTASCCTCRPAKLQSDLNQAFSKIMGLLRAGARTRDALIGALGRAPSAVTARDAWDFIEHCGYRLSG